MDARHQIQRALDVVARVKNPEERVVVKYRTEVQLQNFPCEAEIRVGYGALLDFCAAHTIVIGPPGSAMLECLLNDIRFYSFRNYHQYLANKSLSIEALNRLQDVVYIAESKEELFDNMMHKRVYRPGHSKVDLLHQDGMRLHEIAAAIIASRSSVKGR